MATLNQRGGKLYFDFRWLGTRYREYSDLPDTAGNRKKAEAVLKHLETDIRKGVFELATYFPDSPRLKLCAVKAWVTSWPDSPRDSSATLIAFPRWRYR